MPHAWCPYFVLLEVDGSWLIAHGITSLVDGSPLPAAGPLYVSLRVLPMGWTWSFYIVQEMHEELLRQCGFGRERCQSSKWPTPPLEEGCVAQPYCDNLQILGYSCDEVNASLDSLVTHFK